MKKQFFAKRYYLGFAVMLAAAACQPRAADMQRNPSSESHDGYDQDDDDDGDDGAYGRRNQSLQSGVIESTVESSNATAEVVTTSQDKKESTLAELGQAENAESSIEASFEISSSGSIDENSSAEPASQEIVSTEDSSRDLRLEAVDAIRIISESYQENSSSSSQK